MNEPSGFLFVDEVAAYRDAEALLARVPARTRGKRELLALLARQLGFPHYFGSNWDALDDCLRDLGWLPAGKRVVILHEAMPLRDADQRRTYLDVLQRAVSAWPPGEDHELLAVFPANARTAVTAHGGPVRTPRGFA
jgi:hypothetical protein